MEDKTKYGTIKSERRRFGFPKILHFDFSPEKSDEIIMNLVGRIEEYKKERKMKTEYELIIDNKGNQRISKAKMQSSDGLVKGEINYEPPGTGGGLFYLSFNYNAKIEARFNFNSTDSNNIKEYLGLAEIIKSI